jgi:outer membrane protein assembly factor BamB
MQLAALLPVLLLAWPASQSDDDWRGFRGTDARASSESPAPTSWNDDENIAWSLELLGPGTSSPVVLGESVFVTCWSGYGLDPLAPGDPADLRRHLLCVHRRTGAVLWTATVEPDEAEDPYAERMTTHGYASSTPVTDGEHVYVFFGKSGVLAYGLDGRQQWRTDVGKGSSEWLTGSGSSLALHGDLLFVNASDESASVRALNKDTGKTIWKRETPRLDVAFDTPVIVESGGRTDLVFALLEEIWGLDPQTGDLRWSVTTKTNGAFAPTIVPGDGVIYSLGGQTGQRAYAIRLGGEGDVTASHVLWTSQHGTYVPSPLLHGEHLYWVDDGGIAFCAVAATGELVYRERLGGAFYSSVIRVGDALYAVSREDGTFVLPARPEFELLAHNRIEADESSFDATPAAAGGQLFLRSGTTLYCIESE